MSKSNRATAEATRARILACAREFFGERALEEVTMRDVAEAAGVTVGAVTHYWPNKKALQEDATRVALDENHESTPRLRWTANGYVPRRGWPGVRHRQDSEP